MEIPQVIEVATTPAQALIKQLASTPEESKKYQMVQRGLLYVMLMTGVGLTCVMVRPELADKILKLVMLAVGVVGGLTGGYAGIQGAVDWKNMAALSGEPTTR